MTRITGRKPVHMKKFCIYLLFLLVSSAYYCVISPAYGAEEEVTRAMSMRTGLGANDLGDIAWNGETILVTGSGSLTKRLWGSGHLTSDWLSYREEPGFGRGSMGALYASQDILMVSWLYTEVRDDMSLQTGDGFSVSYDNGQTWEHVSILDLFPERSELAYPGTYTVTYDIAFSEGSLWCATTSGFLLRSDDLGTTWEHVLPDDGEFSFSNPNHHGQCVTAYGDTVWTGTFEGMNVSFDRGEKWTHYSWPSDGTATAGEQYPGNFCVAVESNVVDGKRHVWVGSLPYFGQGTYGICHTEDNGETWEYKSTNFNAWNFAFGHKNADNPAVSDSTVFAASDSGLVVSHDLGNTWDVIPIRESDNLYWDSGLRVFGLLAVADTLWVTSSDGLAMSGDWGESWNIFKGVTRVKTLDAGDRNVGISSMLDDVETYAFPNPFTPGRLDQDYSRARIQYALSEDARVTVKIFDYSGKRVKELIAGEYRAGGRDYQEIWDGRDGDNVIVPNGVYFYIITTNRGDSARGKIMVID